MIDEKRISRSTAERMVHAIGCCCGVATRCLRLEDCAGPIDPVTRRSAVPTSFSGYLGGYLPSYVHTLYPLPAYLPVVIEDQKSI